ncbi:hypothetical protein [Streptomyces sp. NPDC002133]|uniref:hypothetical protein n=1 Tax=Streptomyces sp. NPDC002133 TaxID=3154409 RepID=UPI00332EAAE0
MTRERRIAGAVLLGVAGVVMAASLPYTHGALSITLTVAGVCLALAGAAREFLRSREP